MMTCCEVTTGNALWYHVMEIFGDPLTRQTSVTESNCVTFWSDGDSFTTGGSGERTRSRTASTVLAWLFIVHALCMEACRKSVTVAPTRTIQNKLPRTSLSRVKQKTKMVQSKHHIITHKTNHHHHHQPPLSILSRAPLPQNTYQYIIHFCKQHAVLRLRIRNVTHASYRKKTTSHILESDYSFAKPKYFSASWVLHYFKASIISGQIFVECFRTEDVNEGNIILRVRCINFRLTDVRSFVALPDAAYHQIS